MPKNEIISINSQRELSRQYGLGGLDILMDRKKGGIDFSEGWLGYLGDTIVFEMEFDIIGVEHLIVSLLRNQGAWIFEPERINVYNDGILVGTKVFENALNKSETSHLFTKINLPTFETRKLTVEVIALKHIPDWHSGSKKKPWVFIDEILVY